MTVHAIRTIPIASCLVLTLTGQLFHPVALAAPTEQQERIRTFSKPGPTNWVAGPGKGAFQEID